MNGGETVVIVRGTVATDRRGDTTTDWTNPDIIPIEGCVVIPGKSSEDSNNRDAVITDLTVAMPTGTDIGAPDRIRVRGIDYDVTGNPADYRNPFDASLDGLVVAGRLVAG